jgi:hypothetical protein
MLSKDWPNFKRIFYGTYFKTKKVTTNGKIKTFSELEIWKN